MLGNLPGMAHVWLTQYAQLLAEQDGPVLLLTVNPDHRQDGQTLGCLEAELIEPRVGDVLHRFSPTKQAEPDQEETDNDWFAPFPQTGASRPPEPPAPSHDDADLADLIGFDAARTAVAERRVAPPQTQDSATDSIAQLLRTHLADADPARRVATVLIYADTHPREIDRLLDVGVWTLLTGADPTAVAAAGFALESLAAADPQTRAAEVGVFVLGSPPDKAAAAADQIADAAAGHFDRPLANLGHLQKMRPAAVRTLGTFARLDAQWADLIASLDAMDAPTLEPATARPEIQERTEPAQIAAEPRETPKRQPIPEPPEPAWPKPDQPASATPKPHAETTVRRSVLDDFFTRARHQTQAQTQTTDSDAARRDTEIEISRTFPRTPTTLAETETPQSKRPDTKPQHESRPQRDAVPHKLRPEPAASVASEPQLTNLLADTDPTLDLHVLPVRCPEHPDLQLAAGADGQLHLLARLTDADHPRATLLSLTDARRWATQHRELLALAMSQAPSNGDRRNQVPTDPTLHLFTDQPDRAVPLISRIDPTIRLHLLQHLPLQTGPTWLATPLQTVG